MIKIFKVLFLTIIISFFSNNLKASVLIDPYLGFESGKVTNNELYNGKETGGGFGARLGFIYNNIILALDINLAVLKHKYEDGTTEEKVDLVRAAYGPVVGYKFSILPLKTWFTYHMQSAMVMKSTDLSAQVEFKGNGLKLGLGLTVLPVVDIFIEYFANTYTKGRVKLGSLTSDWTNLSKDIKYQGVLVGVNIPLTLF